MTGGWAATNTLRERTTCAWGHDPPDPECIYCPAFEPYRDALALVQTALEAAWDADVVLREHAPEWYGDHEWPELDQLHVALRAVREGK